MSTLLATHYGLTILSMPNLNHQPFSLGKAVAFAAAEQPSMLL